MLSVSSLLSLQPNTKNKPCIVCKAFPVGEHRIVVLKHPRVIVHFIKISVCSQSRLNQVTTDAMGNNMGSFASNQTWYTENYLFSCSIALGMYSLSNGTIGVHIKCPTVSVSVC